LRCGKGSPLLAGPGWHFASLRQYVGLSWLIECLTGTFWLADRDKALKTATVPAETGRMVLVCLSIRGLCICAVGGLYICAAGLDILKF